MCVSVPDSEFSAEKRARSLSPTFSVEIGESRNRQEHAQPVMLHIYSDIIQIYSNTPLNAGLRSKNIERKAKQQRKVGLFLHNLHNAFLLFIYNVTMYCNVM